MSTPRYLIVNADDFGQSAGVNAGVIESFERGIVTSASLMVRWPGAPAAAAYAREHRNLSVGLHLDLGEWAYRDGEWVALYEVVKRNDRAAVAEEIARQLTTFREMLHRAPTHIDSHQHVHRAEPVRSLLLESAGELGIPLRLFSDAHYCGSFYGQTEDGSPLPEYITVEALERLIDEVGPGVTELGCHPAAAVDFETMYAMERLQERDVLCSDRIRRYVAGSGIDLRSFANLPRASAARLQSHAGEGRDQ